MKLLGLGAQMGEMDADFEEMMRMRNEAKKRLEEQFKDVYQYAIFTYLCVGRSKITSNIQSMREGKSMSR